MSRVLTAVAKGILATASATIALLAALALMPAIMQGEVLTAPLLAHWDGAFSLGLRLDRLSVLFTLMGTGPARRSCSTRSATWSTRSSGMTQFYALMLVFMAGLLMLAGAADMLGAYLAFEVIGLCSYPLVGFWSRQKAAADGARKVLVITHLAGYGFLSAWSSSMRGPAASTGPIRRSPGPSATASPRCSSSRRWPNR